MSNSRSHLAVRALVEGAVFVALSEVLGFLKIWHMPDGGSVSLMMLPLIIYALRWGLGRGILAAFVLGWVDLFIGASVFIGWQSILGDYIVALTALGLAGIGHNKGLPGVILGSLAGCAGRWVCIWATGALLWGEWMPDTFMGMTMTNEWFYSFLYSLPVILSVVLTVVIVILLYGLKPLRPYLLGADLRKEKQAPPGGAEPAETTPIRNKRCPANGWASPVFKALL